MNFLLIFISLTICIGSIKPTFKNTVPKNCGFSSSPMQIVSTQSEGTRIFMKKLIINSPKFGKHVVLYDDQDHETILKHTWCVVKDHYFNRFYAQTRIRLINGKQRQKVLSMHRMLMGFPKGPVDHRNSRKNIRSSTSSQNAMNRKVPDDNTSGYKGVHFNKREQKYQAYICVDGKKHHLGYFLKVLPAAMAYNRAALFYHGEFAKLNQL